MKKLISILVTVIMLLSVLTACDSFINPGNNSGSEPNGGNDGYRIENSGEGNNDGNGGEGNNDGNGGEGNNDGNGGEGNNDPAGSSKKDDSAGSSKGSTSLEYQPGFFDDKSFESQWLNLKFAKPDGYIMATREEINELMGLGAEFAGVSPELLDYANLVSVYEMMVTSPLGTPNIIIMVEKLMLSNMTAEMYLDALKTQLDGMGMGYSFGDIGSTTIAGQSYLMLPVSTSAYGQNLLQQYCIRVEDGRAIGIITTYTEDTTDQLSELLNAFTAYN